MAELIVGLEKELKESKETLEKYNNLSEQASLLRDKIESIENLNRELIDKLEQKENLVKHYKDLEGGYKEILVKTHNANWWTKLTFYKVIKNLINRN